MYRKPTSSKRQPIIASVWPTSGKPFQLMDTGAFLITNPTDEPITEDY